MWRSGHRNILSAVFFTHGRKGLYQKMLPESLWFLEKKNALCFFGESGSHSRKSINMLCVNHLPCYLSIYRSVFLSFILSLYLLIYLTFYLFDLLWFIFLHTVYQRFRLVLAFFPQLPYYRRVLISIFQKTSPTLRFPLIPITRDNMYSGPCDALAPEYSKCGSFHTWKKNTV